MHEGGGLLLLVKTEPSGWRGEVGANPCHSVLRLFFLFFFFLLPPPPPPSFLFSSSCHGFLYFLFYIHAFICEILFFCWWSTFIKISILVIPQLQLFTKNQTSVGLLTNLLMLFWELIWSGGSLQHFWAPRPLCQHLPWEQCPSLGTTTNTM